MARFRRRFRARTRRTFRRFSGRRRSFGRRSRSRRMVIIGQRM